MKRSIRNYSVEGHANRWVQAENRMLCLEDKVKELANSEKKDKKIREYEWDI
jgi:hypothetical protein